MNNIVVSFQNHFNPGQAYVACSRVKTISGLNITNFDEKKNITSRLVTKEMTRLRNQSCVPSPFSIIEHTDALTVAFLNARSARLHVSDIVEHPVLKTVDILCLAESHMYENQLQDYQRHGWNMTALPMLRDENCHGLLIYSSERWPLNDVQMSYVPHMENVHLVTLDGWSPKSICFLYRSPSSNPGDFVQSISEQALKNSPDIFMGDFNLAPDSSNYSSMLHRLTNYSQCVKSPTHRSGSTIDLVFVKDTIQTPTVTVLPTYFSDHSIICLHFAKC